MSFRLEDFSTAAWTQLWQVTLAVLLVALVVRLTCRQRPYLAYILWLLVVIKCLTPPLWSSPTGLFSWVQVQIAEAPQITRLASTGDVEPLLPDTTFVTEADLFPVAGIPENTAADFDSVSAVEPWRTSTVLLTFWIGGVLLTGVILAFHAVRCFRRLRQTEIAADQKVHAALADVRNHLGLRRRVRLLVTTEQVGPAVFGVFRPVLVLPHSLVDSHSLDSLKPILAHELMHVRRGDTLVGLFQLIVQIFWWFHPLIWWSNRQICRIRERLCDEQVIANLALERERYAQSLLDVLKLRKKLRPPLVMPGVRALEITKTRLEDIMNLPPTLHRQMPRFYWLVLVCGIALLLPGAGLTFEQSLPNEGENRPSLAEAESVPADKEETIPVGSGLIYQLPEDGMRVRFDSEMTVLRRNMNAPLNGSVTLSSVGKEVIEGEPCRWLEFSIAVRRKQPERSRPAIMKFLVPEKHLTSGSDPLGNMINGWSQGGAQNEPRQISLPMKPSDGPIYAMLPKPLKNAKRLESKVIDGPLGKLECKGVTGTFSFPERDNEVTITYEIYLHHNAPFGVVSMGLKIETFKEKKLARTGLIDLKLAEVADKATSELSAERIRAVEKRGDSRKIINDFVKLALAGKYDAAVKHVDPNSSVARQLENFTELRDQNVVVDKVYVSPKWTMAITSKFKARRSNEAYLVIHSRLKSEAGQWLIFDIDLENPQSLKGEIQRFREKNPQSKLLTDQPDIELDTNIDP